MKKEKNIAKKNIVKEFHTFEEYQNAFYPSAKTSQTVLIEDPYRFGVQLAQEALNKFKYLLKQT